MDTLFDLKKKKVQLDTPCSTEVIKAIPDGLHSTPPMGWTSWNAFFGYCNEGKMMAQVQGVS